MKASWHESITLNKNMKHYILNQIYQHTTAIQNPNIKRCTLTHVSVQLLHERMSSDWRLQETCQPLITSEESSATALRHYTPCASYGVMAYVTPAYTLSSGQGQGHREFPFGNSREFGIAGGNSREFCENCDRLFFPLLFHYLSSFITIYNNYWV